MGGERREWRERGEREGSVVHEVTHILDARSNSGRHISLHHNQLYLHFAPTRVGCRDATRGRGGMRGDRVVIFWGGGGGRGVRSNSQNPTNSSGVRLVAEGGGTPVGTPCTVESTPC